MIKNQKQYMAARNQLLRIEEVLEEYTNDAREVSENKDLFDFDISILISGIKNLEDQITYYGVGRDYHVMLGWPTLFRFGSDKFNSKIVSTHKTARRAHKKARALNKKTTRGRYYPVLIHWGRREARLISGDYVDYECPRISSL